MDTEERVRKGVAYFKEGYNCAQSVVMAFADYYGLDEAFAAHISGSLVGASAGCVRPAERHVACSCWQVWR